ncbi:hypothetical protein BDW_08450 [Bdellovibrio bacteriovorus W]|nr:hypothetical protein BDW_08450 [Bdellovibrio bacteriovorus W]
MISGPAPKVEWVSLPQSPTNSMTHIFEFSVSRDNGAPISSIQCSVNGGAYIDCESPFIVPWASGELVLSVVAKNEFNLFSKVLSASILIDTDAPEVALSSEVADYFSASNFEVLVDFSEAIIGFSIEDIVVTNGTASALSGGPTRYKVLVTPAAQGLVTVAIPADVITDLAGNGNKQSPVLSRTFDSVRPSLSLSSAVKNSFNSADFLVLAQFSEVVTDFSESDVVVTNGSISGFSGDGTNFSFTITPHGQGSVEVKVPDHVAFDRAGNGNITSSLNRIYDTVPPSLTLSTSTGDPFSSPSFTVVATFSEDVFGFDSSDLVITNGTVTGFSGNGFSYSFIVTPSGQGVVKVNVPPAVAEDAAGNSNTAANELQRTFDNTPPTVILSSPIASHFNSGGFVVTVVFSEPVSGFNAAGVALSNGTLSNFAGSGEVYTFTITPLAQGNVVVGVPAGVAFDLAGNGNVIASNLTRVFDSISPSLSLSTPIGSAFRAANFTVTAEFSEAVTGFSLGDIQVANGTAGTFNAVSSSTYTFLVTPSAQGNVTVSVGAGVAIDAAGNGNTAAANLVRLYDTGAPSVAITSYPSAHSSLASPNFSFTGSDSLSGLAGFQCKVNAGAFAGCTSGVAVSAVVGSNTFSVISLDVAGNQSTPGTYTWKRCNASNNSTAMCPGNSRINGYVSTGVSCPFASICSSGAGTLTSCSTVHGKTGSVTTCNCTCS